MKLKVRLKFGQVLILSVLNSVGQYEKMKLKKIVDPLCERFTYLIFTFVNWKIPFLRTIDRVEQMRTIYIHISDETTKLANET